MSRYTYILYLLIGDIFVLKIVLVSVFIHFRSEKVLFHSKFRSFKRFHFRFHLVFKKIAIVSLSYRFHFSLISVFIKFPVLFVLILVRVTLCACVCVCVCEYACMCECMYHRRLNLKNYIIIHKLS